MNFARNARRKVEEPRISYIARPCTTSSCRTTRRPVSCAKRSACASICSTLLADARAKISSSRLTPTTKPLHAPTTTGWHTRPSAALFPLNPDVTRTAPLPFVTEILTTRLRSRMPLTAMTSPMAATTNKNAHIPNTIASHGLGGIEIIPSDTTKLAIPKPIPKCIIPRARADCSHRTSRVSTHDGS